RHRTAWTWPPDAAATRGRQLSGQERAALAARLPVEAALVLTEQASATEPLAGWAFVKELATRTATTPAVARWDAGSVLTTLAFIAGPDLLTRILGRLPAGNALLFGRAELLQAA
ncbi:DUF2267 domain-containing protein, partial [Streptomyces sp. 150FB]|uniref:DUF2267 domain-containing protein n=1 Tax=Streptomyces sp. 150FB TaxID=1576605 RepID=UPI000696574A